MDKINLKNAVSVTGKIGDDMVRDIKSLPKGSRVIYHTGEHATLPISKAESIYHLYGGGYVIPVQSIKEGYGTKCIYDYVAIKVK